MQTLCNKINMINQDNNELSIKATKLIKTARNISFVCFSVILYQGYKAGVSYWTLLYLFLFLSYAILISKGSIAISILGLISSILFSISFLNLSTDIFAIIFILVINYGFIVGIIGTLKLKKLSQANANA